jgi:hypothetical protein
VLLITDGLCYSATDIFAAGFQDHDIGPILGTSGNTGAGGANVWTHYLLQRLMHEPGKPYLSDPESPFRPLPHGADMRVAVRRTLRVGERAGIPLEDLGVVPDAYHLMTRRDLMEGNIDLLEEAGRILARKPVYRLSVEIESLKRTTLKAKVYTQNLSRLDIFLGGRPQGSLNVGDGHRQLVLDVPLVSDAGDVLHLELRGYADGKLAAGRRVRIPRLADDLQG